MTTSSRFLDSRSSTHARVPEALGESEAFIDFQERLSRAAKVDRPVLIVGERGTGKELAVNRLHFLSSRWQGPLVALNCAALSPTVVESELFGHEAGAFTGAARRRAGRFEAAESGTLFLDEIGLIPIEVQEKILRVVEYREFERVGGSQPVQVDVRLLGATNADLPTLAGKGQFKRDLLDRLSFEVLFLPPLRERTEDIMLLARHFGTRMAMEMGRRDAPEFSEEATDRLEAYGWPGNIRELKNVIERSVYRSPGTRIDVSEIIFDPFVSPYSRELEELPTAGEPVRHGERRPGNGPIAAETVIPGPAHPSLPFDLNAAVRALELKSLQSALAEAHFHQGEAAKLLQLSYHQFRGLYRKYQDEIRR